MKIFDITIFWIQIAPTYYGLMYALWFIWGYYILKKRQFLKIHHLDDLFIYIVLWVILWGRIGYMLFYNFSHFIWNPFSIIRIWEWWMSFHWWVIGVIIAMFIFSKIKKINFLSLSDQVCLVLPLWLWLGRFWNYLNKELLWFSNYNWPFSVVINDVWYFPSPLLEMFLEWIILFLILNYFYKKNVLAPWQIASLFLVLYWIFRIFVEVFFREPDVHIGLIGWIVSVGTILSLPMIIAGIFCFIYFRKK